MREQTTIVPTHELFLETAKKYGDKTAVIDLDRSYTYAEMAEFSARPLAALSELGTAEGRTALLIMNSDAWGIIAILSALRAGYAYAFMEPTQSVDFIRSTIQQLKPSVLITTSAHKQFAGQFWGDDLPLLDIQSFKQTSVPTQEAKWDMEQPAMVYFTSGSTGTPKGLMLNHRVNTNRTLWNTLMPILTDQDVIALSMSFQFVRSPEAIWMTFSRGATAAIYRFQDHTISELAAWIEKYGVTILQMPSTFADKFIHAIKDYPEYKLGSLRMISVGGEKINFDAVRVFQRVPNINFTFRFQVGSSETSSYYYTDYDRQTELSDTLWFESVTSGYKILVKDEESEEFKDRDAVGELYVGSEKLFLDYLGAGQDAGQKMINNPDVPGGRLYATGDIGEIDSEGRMRIIGRKDKMVKIRGFRMDLEEISIKIQALERVSNAICVAKGDKRGEKKLIAYIEFMPDARISIPNLRAELLANLEPYKIPNRFVVLKKLPLTPTGKIAVTELPAAEKERPELDTTYAAPNSAQQKALAEIWEEVLDLDMVGINDNFFELGGDSISVLEMFQLVEEKLGIKLSANFINSPTIAAIQKVSEDGGRAVSKDSPMNDQNKIARRGRSRQFNAKFERDPFIRFLGQLLPRFSFERVNQFSRMLSGNWLVQQLFMFRYREVYDRWLSEFKGVDKSLFRKKVVFSELLRIANRALHIKIDASEVDLKNLERYSWHKYFYSMNHAYLDHEPGSDLPEFPTLGLEHARNAVNGEKPVIFVSFHSSIYINSRPIMEYQCGVKKIETITKNLGIHGKYSEVGKTESMEDQALSNAGVSIRALGLVEQGIPIIFYSDTIDPLTKNYSAAILGRRYSIKGGFAEIAEAVGGVIIPTVGFITDDLKIGRLFGPPLTSDKTDPSERIEDLVTGYALFMENVHKQWPSTKNLNKIKNHYKNRVNV